MYRFYGILHFFRIGNDFSFDDEISDRFDCKVLAFDPTMGVGKQINIS